MQIDFKNKIYEGSNNRKNLFDCKIPNKAKAVIIFVHGYKGYKDWGAWGLMEDYFLNNEFGFVKFNMSHNGGTLETPIDFPDLEAFGKNTYSFEVYDLNLIIEETSRIISQECGLDIPIYLLGHSRGGGVAVLVAAKNEKVKKIISLAGICDIGKRFPSGDELREWEFDGVKYVENSRTNQAMPHFFSFYQDFAKHKSELNIEDAATQLSMPFIQIHGDMDLSVSISEGQYLSRWTETELKIVKGAGHTFGAMQPWAENILPEDLKTALDFACDFFDSILEE